LNQNDEKQRAVIGLGSNLPDRFAWLQEALDLWRGRDRVEVVGWSRVYETDPVGEDVGGDFLNAVMVIDTTLGPWELLQACRAIEEECGRDRNAEQSAGSRNRTLDCDVLFYGDTSTEINAGGGDSEALIIPHPRWSEREFVIMPLMDVSGELTQGQKRLVQNVTNPANNDSASCRIYGKMLD